MDILIVAGALVFWVLVLFVISYRIFTRSTNSGCQGAIIGGCGLPFLLIVVAFIVDGYPGPLLFPILAAVGAGVGWLIGALSGINKE